MKSIAKAVILVSALTACVNASANEKDEARVLAKLQQTYPGTKFQSVRVAQIEGLFAVTMGKNVAYTDKNARYFIFGNLFDMQTQTDMTATKEEIQKAAWPEASLQNAIVTVKGSGERKVALFSDVDCPYCKMLESTLAQIDNVTIYTFLFPLDQLHPEARSISESVWCSENPSQAYQDYVLRGVKPAVKSCHTPIDKNLELGAKLGVRGTPTLIGLDGSVMPGAASKEQLEAWLDSTNAGEKK